MPATSPYRLAAPVLGVIAVLTFAPTAIAQDTWTGTSTNAPANLWTDATNWNTSVVPGSGNADTALFNSGGNGNTNVSLGGATLTPGAILFDTAGVASYTIGSVPGDGTFTISGLGANSGTGGLVTLSNTVTTPQVINSNLVFTGAGTAAYNPQSPPGTLTPVYTLNNSGHGTAGVTSFTGTTVASTGATGPVFIVNGAVTLGSGLNDIYPSFTNGGQTNGSPITIVNGVIKDNPNGASIIRLQGGGSTTGSGPGVADTLTAGTWAPNAQNTYSGGTFLNAQNTIVLITTNSTGGDPVNGLPTSGPLGTGPLSTTANASRIRPAGGSYVLYNQVLLAGTGGSSLSTESNQTNDPNSLTFAGPIVSPTATTGGITGGRFITNGFNNSEGFATPLYGATMILGLAANPSTFTLPSLAAANTNFAALTGPMVINDVIQNSPTTPAISTNVIFNPQGPDMYSIQINGASTYPGTTMLGGGANASMGAFLIGVSTNGPPGAFTIGPFGTSTVTMNNSTSPPDLVPVGADRTIANAITAISSGFFVSNSWTNTVNIRGTISTTTVTDPTGPHSLTLSGPITLGTAAQSRTITNNLVAGATLTLGLPGAAASTITLGGATGGATLTIQSNTGGPGVTIINDAIGGSGGLTVQNGATVTLTNANTYGGTTLVFNGNSSATGPAGTLIVNGSNTGIGPVNVTGNFGPGGAAAVGTGGKLLGTGSIGGLITVSSTAAAKQGGVIDPGSGGTTAGTLNVASMAWNPFGRYVFAYSPTNAMTGGGLNNLIGGTGFLDLANLSGSNPFDLNLLQTFAPPTPIQQTYTIATFVNGIGASGTPFADGADISSLFTLSGAVLTAPATYATVVAGPGGGSSQSIQLTFTPSAPGFSLWTGVNSGNWSDANNWAPAGVPASNLNTALLFGATPNTAMTNDVTGTLTLNSMTFNSAAPVYTLGGNGLNFVTNGNGVLPQIVQNSSNGVTISVALTLTNNLAVSGRGNLALNGAIGGPGGLTYSGVGTLTLGTANSYAGGTNVLNGTVAVAADANLGTGNVTGAATGTLAFTGTTATTKSFAMNGGTISVAATQTVTFNGGDVSAAYLDGTGTFASNGGQFVSVKTTPSVTVTSTSAADQFVHVTNGGTFNVAPGLNAGAAVLLKGFINQGSGAVTVGQNSQINVANFQSYGMLTLNSGTFNGSSGGFTQLTNLGSSKLFFNGGSRTFISTPAQAVNINAGIDLHGNDAVVADGLFVNNGYVIDSTGGGHRIVADFGAVVKGAGFYQTIPQTINGGTFSTGNSPGSATTGAIVLGGPNDPNRGLSNYTWQINDAGPSAMYRTASGTAGPMPNSAGQVSGWGLLTGVAGTFPVTTTGNFSWDATPTDPFTIHLQTLSAPNNVNGQPSAAGGYETSGDNTAGLMSDFDPNETYYWKLFNYAGTYTGPTDTATLDASTIFDTSGFLNPHTSGIYIPGGGPFLYGPFFLVLDQTSKELDLVYAPTYVPEPGTLSLVGLAAITIGWIRRRRLQPVR